MDILTDLKEQGLITDEVNQAVETAVSEGVTVEQALIDQKIDKEIIREQFARFYGVPSYTPTDELDIPQDVLEYISAESAKHYEIIPLALEDEVLVVGANDPENLRVREVLNFISSKHGIPYKFVFLLDDDLQKLLAEYDSLTGEVDKALTSLETELEEEIKDRKQEESDLQKTAEDHIKEDAPVTKIVATILRYAVDGLASDIHIEPTGGKIQVRFRVDGLLQTSLELPENVHSAVVARVKILSSMRLDEKRKPQDGRFSATFDGRKIDFRVSVLPTNHGEKVVMRILDTEKGVKSLEETGISGNNLQLIQKAIKEPFGIILISGPTGSGKTTTLYAILAEIDKQTKNVISLEDPVEYNIDGVSQSQVRPEIGYTFASGLRSSLRQDPDIIMVGEIRDRETAQLAVQAALTGHLVLSTIHTNNAIGVVPRLVDMGIDPYLIAPTLKLAMAQRLTRRLCEGGEEVPVDESMKADIAEQFADLPEKYRKNMPEVKTIFHPRPSPGCDTGTKGRVAISEVLPINNEIEAIILKGGSDEEMYKAARKHGFMTMKEDAIAKSLQGMIPYEEVGAFGLSLELDEELGGQETVEVEAKPPTAPEAIVETVDNSKKESVPDVYNEGEESL